MAVMPAFERALVLDIDEVMIPFELGDAGGPLGVDRKQREDAERGDDG